MNKAQIIFKKDGCIKLENVFNKSDLKDLIYTLKVNLINIGFNSNKLLLKKNIQQLISELYKKDKKIFFKFYSSIQNNHQVYKLASSQKLIGAVSNLLNINRDSIFLGDLTMRVDNPGTSTAAIGWHQESTYYSEIKDFKKSILVWFPILDISIDGGGLQFIPGSHIGKKRKFKFDLKKKDYIYPELDNILKKKTKIFSGKAGSILACNFNLFHASSINLTNKFRLSGAFRYFSTEVKSSPYIKKIRLNKNFIKYRLKDYLNKNS